MTVLGCWVTHIGFWCSSCRGTTDTTRSWDLSLLTQSIKSNPSRDRLPFEIVKGVNCLNFDPPASFLQDSPYQAWVITWSNNEFVAVFNICILKRYFLLYLFIYWVSIQIQGLLLWVPNKRLGWYRLVWKRLVRSILLTIHNTINQIKVWCGMVWLVYWQTREWLLCYKWSIFNLYQFLV